MGKLTFGAENLGMRTPSQSTEWTGGRLLHRNVQRFQDGLVFKAHRLLYHSTLGLRVKKKKEEASLLVVDVNVEGLQRSPQQCLMVPVAFTLRLRFRVS